MESVSEHERMKKDLKEEAVRKVGVLWKEGMCSGGKEKFMQ